MRKLIGFFAFATILIFASLTAQAQSYTAYLTGAQETPAVATAATGKARVVLNATAGTISYTVVYNNLSSAQILAHIHGPAPVGTAAPVLITFPNPGGTSGTITGTSPITPTQIAQMRSGQCYVNVHSTNNAGGEIRGQLHTARPVDFDGDGRTDYSVLRFPAGPPSPITYYNLNSTNGPSGIGPFGDAQTDFPAPGDYDGDGKDDVCLYRQGATAGAFSVFLILRTSDNTFQPIHWGVMGDQAINRDYDGDGITDCAVFRRGVNAGDQAFFFIRRADNSQISVPFGTTGDVAGGTTGDTPVVGDYDGDGKIDLAVYRFGGLVPNNTFIVQRSSDGVIAYQAWGNFQTDYVVPGDYDGDGKTDYAIARTGATATSPMTWIVLRSSDGATFVRQFGISSDLPTQGDYDGDGKTDPAVDRKGTIATSPSIFYVLRSFDGVATGTSWGNMPDFPTATFDAR